MSYTLDRLELGANPPNEVTHTSQHAGVGPGKEVEQRSFYVVIHAPKTTVSL